MYVPHFRPSGAFVSLDPSAILIGVGVIVSLVVVGLHPATQRNGRGVLGRLGSAWNPATSPVFWLPPFNDEKGSLDTPRDLPVVQSVPDVLRDLARTSCLACCVVGECTWVGMEIAERWIEESGMGNGDEGARYHGTYGE